MKTWLDNRIFIFLGKVVDVIWISLLWYVTCIPVITVGASSAALYYTVHKNLFEGRGYLFSTYKSAIKDNFRKATVLWLICLLLDAFLIFDFILTRMAIDQGSILAVLYYPVLICIVLAVMWQLSIMAYQARFEDTIEAILRKAAVIAFRNIGWMLFLTVFLAGLICLCRYLIVIIVFIPGGYACLMHHVFEHIYKKTGWI